MVEARSLEQVRSLAPVFLGFDHLHLYVGNSLQAAVFYATRFGFQVVGYRGLETGSRRLTSYVLQQGRIVIVLSAALNPNDQEFADFLAKHGDGIKDVAFEVEDARAAFAYAVERGAQPVQVPIDLTDEHGSVTVATVSAGYGDLDHSFIERRNWRGARFLPGFGPPQPDMAAESALIQETLPSCLLSHIDHCVSNQPDQGMEPVVDWYTDKLGFHRFWSVDDRQIHTEYSSLRSIVVTDANERIKMPVNEPAPGLRKSQIQEYVEYYGGPGIQHVALYTSDILRSVAALKERGVSFIQVPPAYYTLLRERLRAQQVQVKEDIDAIQRLQILVDIDEEGGYLLQTFTKPVSNRPTLFYEIIQRHRNTGFGVGNFKALFEAIERDQAKRGNL
jgi:4-hydroxyphenylpyruvate dioxygenase